MFNDYEFEAEAFPISNYLENHSLIKLKEGENRFVVILAINFKQLVYLVDTVDAEKVLLLSDQFSKMIIHKIYKYGGFVERRRSEILAYFGILRNTEFDIKRAILCSQTINIEFQKFKKQIDIPSSISINIQQAIHVGSVITTKINPQEGLEYSIWGNDINYAIQLTDQITTDAIIVTNKVKDIAPPEYIFEPIQISTYTSENNSYYMRPEKERKNKANQDIFLGRTKDLEHLQNIYHSYKKNFFYSSNPDSYYLEFSAEKGIGKARLAKELIRQIADEGDAFLYLRGKAENLTNTPYALFSNMLKRYIGISSYDTIEQAKLKIENAIDLLQQNIETNALSEQIPFIGLLLGIKYEDSNYKLFRDSLHIKIQLAIKLFFETIAQKSKKEKWPLIICIENLNALDSHSMDLLNTIFKQNNKNGIFFIITTDTLQSIFVLEKWPHAYTFSLAPLNKQETRELIGLLLKNDVIAENVITQLQEKAMGNPLYIEEWIKLVKHSLRNNDNCVDASQISVPDSVKTIILSRIDSLSDHARALLQKASVIGNTFDIRILEKMLLRIEQPYCTHKVFQELLLHSLIVQEDYNGITFRFYHSLIHTAAYETLLTSNKKLLHALAANAIENTFGEQLNSYYNILANHYEIAEINKKTIEYLQLEAEKALNEFANHRALQLYLKLIEKFLKENLNPELIAETYINISTMYCLSNEIALAGMYLEKAKKMTENIKSESLKNKIIHLNRGTYYIKLLAMIHKQSYCDINEHRRAA